MNQPSRGIGIYFQLEIFVMYMFGLITIKITAIYGRAAPFDILLYGNYSRIYELI